MSENTKDFMALTEEQFNEIPDSFSELKKVLKKYKKDAVYEIPKNNEEVIKILNNDKILFYILYNNKNDILKVFIECGVDVNAKNSIGLTLLCIAIEKENEEMVKSLIEKRARVKVKSSEGLTLLHIAAKTGNKNIVEYLIGLEKININVKDNKGQTPLQYAVKEENEDTIKTLIESGADINEKDN